MIFIPKLILHFFLTILLTQCQNSGGRGASDDESPKSASSFSGDGSLDAANSGLDQMKEGLEKLKDSVGDDSQKGDALNAAGKAIDDLKKAYSALASLGTAADLAAARNALSRAENIACQTGVKLANAGFEAIAVGFFEVCSKKWIFEAQIRKESFYRDTQSDSFEELLRLVTVWGYQRVVPVYRVYKAIQPYPQEPSELANSHVPKRLVPLYRCWESSANYYFQTFRSNCDGAPQVSNPPDPMGNRRILGYVSTTRSAVNYANLLRFRNLGIPNDVARPSFKSDESISGYEALGSLGFVSF